MKYGGRHFDYFCFYNEKWRHLKTSFFRWNGSSWVLVDTEPASAWRSTGTPDLDYHTINTYVTLNGGALVDDHIEYKGSNQCDGPTLKFLGMPTRHYLE